MTYRLTRRARQDLLAIWEYIAQDSEPAADRFIERFTSLFERLGEHPYLGRVRNDLRSGYRSFPLGQYLVLYRVRKPSVVILHIVHGRRDLRRYPFEA